MLRTVDAVDLEYVGVLAQLELSPQEKKQVKEDMARMIAYVDKLRELPIRETKPLTHVLPLQNVFREDVVSSGGAREDMLANAPARKNNMFVVPRTIDEA